VIRLLIPDVNLLVYACNSNSPSHQDAHAWWEATLQQPRVIGLPWATSLGFIRIVTHPKILKNPMSVKDAIHRVRAWLDHPHVQIVTPGDRHGEILFNLLTEAGTGGNLTSDAHLAALAFEYRAEIASADADFSRFPGLRWFNPLATRHRTRPL
jgi:toxin-antitoxin system PIN domain toxin